MAFRVAPRSILGVSMNADGRWVIATDEGVVAGRKDRVEVHTGRLAGR